MTKNHLNAFISYQLRDKLFATNLRNALVAKGIFVFLDTDLKADENWSESLRDKLNDSDLFVSIVPDNNHQSANSFFELGAATGAKKRIVTVLPHSSRMQMSDIAAKLSNYQLVQAENKSPEQVADSILSFAH